MLSPKIGEADRWEWSTLVLNDQLDAGVWFTAMADNTVKSTKLLLQLITKNVPMSVYKTTTLKASNIAILKRKIQRVLWILSTIVKISLL